MRGLKGGRENDPQSVHSKEVLKQFRGKGHNA